MRAKTFLVILIAVALLCGLFVVGLGAGTPNLPKAYAQDTPEFEGFNPDDGRVEGDPTDRLVIYCDAEWREFEVWGIRPDSSGYRLTIFVFDDLTEVAGRAVLQTARDGSRIAAVIDRTLPIFTVQWFDGPYNANGVPPFAKRFRCPFEWTRAPTSTPIPRAPRLPVITLTPSPTPTPLPTRASF